MYSALPSVTGGALQNRFVGSYLLYGVGSGWSKPRVAEDPEVFAVAFARSAAAYALPLKHGVDRIEALGHQASLAAEEQITICVLGSSSQREQRSQLAGVERPHVDALVLSLCAQDPQQEMSAVG